MRKPATENLSTHRIALHREGYLTKERWPRRTPLGSTISGLSSSALACWRKIARRKACRDIQLLPKS